MVLRVHIKVIENAMADIVMDGVSNLDDTHKMLVQLRSRCAHNSTKQNHDLLLFVWFFGRSLIIFIMSSAKHVLYLVVGTVLK